MILETSPLFSEPADGRSPVFWSPLWRTALSCFTFGRAMTLDLQFGSLETTWLMEERMSGQPSSHTWLLATYEHSLGLMLRLQTFGVPCPHVDDIVQYAINKNQLDTLVLFTSTEFVFRGLDGHPIRDSKFVPRLDRAVLHGYHDVVKYCVWRYETHKERLLKRPLETVAHLMAHNYKSMLKTIVPRLVRIGNLTGLRAACQKGYTALVQYALDHLDPVFCTAENLPDELMVVAAKHGHLPLLRLLKRHKNGFIPRKAYQQAFSWGRMDVCQYIAQRFPDYRPDESDILDACAHGHVAAIESLPRDTPLPNECMEKAIKSLNPKMIYVLHARLPHLAFNLTLLHEAIHSKHSDVCLAVFDCGGYKRLPLNHDVELTRNRMRKALKVFHSIGFKVYTERAFVEACRICSIDIIRDILELPPGERPVIKETAWTTALCAIQVSPEIRRDKRIEAHDYVNAKFQEFKDQPPEEEHDDEEEPATIVRAETEEGREAPRAVSTSHRKRPLRDDARPSKRLKHVQRERRK